MIVAVYNRKLDDTFYLDGDKNTDFDALIEVGIQTRNWSDEDVWTTVIEE